MSYTDAQMQQLMAFQQQAMVGQNFQNYLGGYGNNQQAYNPTYVRNLNEADALMRRVIPIGDQIDIPDIQAAEVGGIIRTKPAEPEKLELPPEKVCELLFED